jgi:hypothetical protein
MNRELEITVRRRWCVSTIHLEQFAREFTTENLLDHVQLRAARERVDVARRLTVLHSCVSYRRVIRYTESGCSGSGSSIASHLLADEPNLAAAKVDSVPLHDLDDALILLGRVLEGLAPRREIVKEIFD